MDMLKKNNGLISDITMINIRFISLVILIGYRNFAFLENRSPDHLQALTGCPW